MAAKTNKLTVEKVRKIIDSFLRHIANHWEFYRHNLPHLRRTLMIYTEFANGIRYLPENKGSVIEFNPNDPLLDNLPRFFRKQFNDNLKNLINDARPSRRDDTPWEGYRESINNDTPGGTPDICYRGFTTIKEFSAQKVFLNSVRNHPRVKLGIKLMEKCYQRQKAEKEQERKT